ncbi:MAG: serine/threonine protein kinase [Proteobacteria bacterium]|nr:serine/threonine protein kinase [Pseudomonadota bacterium]
MSDAPNYARTFTALWPTLRVDADQAAPTDTIRPSLSTANEQETMEVLLPTPSPHSAVRGFGTTLGEGGMGLVRLAEQSSMQRQVAVKSLRAGTVRPSVARRLVQEAWVTGYLEHPNIVPVYDIAEDESGHPVILMKRIEGRTWEHLLRHDDDVREAFAVTDVHDWHLRIFLTVCNAVHFAHEHGVLHRDIKPENIMIGRFGEVYLLDWGIAVGLDDRHEGRLPVASRERRLAGTPRFMAPEMAIGDGGQLGPWTDVYLLGSTLFNVLTGEPPHQGPDLERLLYGIIEFKPTAQLGIPPALLPVLQQAMAADPEDRLGSVEAFAHEVQLYLDRRASVDLAYDAAVLLDELGATHNPQDFRALHARITFALQRALRSWDGNTEARNAMARAHELAVDHAVQHDNLELAQSALAEIDDPVRLAAVRELEARVAKEAEELVALRRAWDPKVGVRARMLLLGIISTLWVVMPILGMMRGAPTWTSLFNSSATLLVFMFGLGFWLRESLFKSEFNRQTGAALLSIPIAQLLIDGVGWLHGVTPVVAFSFRQSLWFVVALMYTLLVTRGLWPATVVIGVMALVGAADPPNAYACSLVSNVAMAINGIVIWGPSLRRRADAT